MSAPVLPFTVIPGGRRRRRAPRRRVEPSSPLLAKVAELERLRPDAVPLVEDIVLSLLCEVGGDEYTN